MVAKGSCIVVHRLRFDDLEHARDVHPLAKSNDPCVPGEVGFRASALLVDTENQVRYAGVPQPVELVRHVVSGPKPEYLHEPSAGRLETVTKKKIGKDQRASRGDRLGLTKRLPIECESPEVPRESLFEFAVVPARLCGWKQRIAGADLERDELAPDPTERGDEKARTSGNERHELAERPAVDARVAKERKRAGNVDAGLRRFVVRTNTADQSPEPGVSDDGSDGLVSRHLDLGSSAEQVLCESGVDGERKVEGLRRRRGNHHAPFAGNVREQNLFELSRADTQLPGRLVHRFPASQLRGGGELEDGVPSPDRIETMPLLRTKAPFQSFRRGGELQRRSGRPERLAKALLQLTPASSFEARELPDQHVQPRVIVRPEIVDAPDTVPDVKRHARFCHEELRRVEPLVPLRSSPER